MAFCPRCTAEIDQMAATCPECGWDFASLEPESAEPGWAYSAFADATLMVGMGASILTCGVSLLLVVTSLLGGKLLMSMCLALGAVLAFAMLIVFARTYHQREV